MSRRGRLGSRTTRPRPSPRRRRPRRASRAEHRLGRADAADHRDARPDRAARRSRAMAPLLVAGHTHTADLGRIGSSWYLNSGTVGGVDFAKLYSDPSIAHCGVDPLLHRDAPAPPRRDRPDLDRGPRRPELAEAHRRRPERSRSFASRLRKATAAKAGTTTPAPAEAVASAVRVLHRTVSRAMLSVA